MNPGIHPPIPSRHEELSRRDSCDEGSSRAHESCGRPQCGKTGSVSGDIEGLLADTGTAMVLLDNDLCVRRFTPSAASLLDLALDDVGRSMRNLSQASVDPFLVADALAAIETGEGASRVVQAKDGPRYVRRVLPYRSFDGSISGVVIVIADVSARAAYDDLVCAGEILESVRVPMLVIDDELRVELINQQFSELFHETVQSIKGRTIGEVGNGALDDAPLLRLLRAVPQKGSSVEEYEIHCKSPVLGRRELVVSARKLRCGRGRTGLVLVEIDDVTERKRIQNTLRENELRCREEERVRQRHIELTNAQRLSTVGELASGLAHELNQPLASISNVVEACSRYVRAGTTDASKLLELLSDAAGETMRAAAIVAQLRSYVDKGEPRFNPVDLAELVSSVPHLLVRELERTRIGLRVIVADARLDVHADKVQIEQVLLNLIQNAIDSIEEAGGPDRSIILSAQRVNGMGEVSVRDTGKGVSMEAADRMFEAFFYDQSPGTRNGARAEPLHTRNAPRPDLDGRPAG